MRIKKILRQNRRDLVVLLVCEHCGQTHQTPGYDDRHYHEVVVPSLVCVECNRVSPPGFQPLQPKYPEGMSV